MAGVSMLLAPSFVVSGRMFSHSDTPTELDKTLVVVRLSFIFLSLVFRSLGQMAEDVLKIPGELDLDKKRAAVEHRRCILLALLACTSPNNPTLKKLLSAGLLVTVKAWLDDILSGAIGTLSLLSLKVSVKPLPLPVSSHTIARSCYVFSLVLQEASTCCSTSFQVSKICLLLNPMLSTLIWERPSATLKSTRYAPERPTRPLSRLASRK